MTNSAKFRLAGTIVIVLVLAMILYFTFNSKKVDFNAEVRPILNNNCTACHGGVKKAGDISFIFRDEALGKGESGKICIKRRSGKQ